MWGSPLEYGRLTWPEVARGRRKRVPIVPVGTLEDHGLHLPIDTDVTLVEAICRATAERSEAHTVLLPSIVHGYSPHHMDYPGTVTIAWDTFCRYCTDVALSLVRHGFKRVLLVNGHGSNQNLVEMAARLTMVEEPESLVAASSISPAPAAPRSSTTCATPTSAGWPTRASSRLPCTSTCTRRPSTWTRPWTSGGIPRPITRGWTGPTGL